MGKIANRRSLAILDRGLKSQPFSQFCCIPMFKTYRQSRVSNRNFKSQGRLRFESRVFKSLPILDMVCLRVDFHENDGNQENDENDEDNSDSYT